MNLINIIVYILHNNKEGKIIYKKYNFKYKHINNLYNRIMIIFQYPFHYHKLSIF